MAGPDSTEASYGLRLQEDETLITLRELRQKSSLTEVPVGSALQALKGSAVGGKLARDDFLKAYGELLATHDLQMPPEDVQSAIFGLFDRDNNGMVDMMELICGISILCGGSEEEKIHAIFNIFDENGDSYISMDEMFKFLSSVFRVVLTPQVKGALSAAGVQVVSAEDVAALTALECFKQADLNHDGKLSLSEFKSWFYSPRQDSSILSPMAALR